MKNILIIAKMKLFKQENSQNRYNFLTFLDTKNNICIIEDSSQNINEIQQTLEFKPDIIIYYCLGAANKWHDIAVEGLETSIIPTYLFFEDYHWTTTVITIYKKYNFKALIIPINQHKAKQYYKSENIPVKVWGFFIDTDEFCNRSYPKEYDILLYGFLSKPEVYPLRYKIYACLYKIKQLYPRCRIKYIQHPGYNNFSKMLPRGKDLSILLNKSKFAIATSSVRNLFLKKYIEIPLSGCYLVGDIPEDYRDNLKDNIIEIDKNANHNNIMNILLAILQGKYDHLLNKKNMDDYATNLKKEYCFEAGYDKLCRIMDDSKT